MKGVYIFLAEGFEDVEALATADVLRRGGVPVELVSLGDEPFVVSSHRVAVGVDQTFDYFALHLDRGADERDVMIFPGGMPGTRNLAGNGMLMDMMQEHYDEGGTVAAICAAPGLVLSQLEGIAGKRVTCARPSLTAASSPAAAPATPSPSDSRFSRRSRAKRRPPRSVTP